MLQWAETLCPVVDRKEGELGDSHQVRGIRRSSKQVAVASKPSRRVANSDQSTQPSPSGRAATIVAPIWHRFDSFLRAPAQEGDSPPAALPGFTFSPIAHLS
jgi:hypothetical protein